MHTLYCMLYPSAAFRAVKPDGKFDLDCKADVRALESWGFQLRPN